MSLPPTQARIDLRSLSHNLETIRSRLARPVRVIAVVKADCYGHSDAICVPELVRRGIDAFAVASLEEGARLRALGISERIIVIRPPLPGQCGLYARHDLEAMVSTAETAGQLDSAAAESGRTIRVHLYVDSGMVRNGVAPAEALEMLRTIDTLSGLKLQGIASHFATSDEIGSRFASEQIAIFRSVLAGAAAEGFEPEDIHMANSGGIFNHPESHFTAVRPGISLYGYHPTESCQASSGLEPVMTLRTEIAGIKRIGPGISISYGRTHYTDRPTTVATLPIGYADGLPRAISNRYSVLIRGRRYRGIGAICMDEVMIDLAGDEMEIGEEVMIMGRSGDQRIDAWELAEMAGTIPYEICTGIGTRVPRSATATN